MSRAPAIVRREPGEADEPFALAGGKWTILVIGKLGESKKRFNELRREIGGVSQKTLTSTLRSLERDGFVIRTLFPTIPPRVEYELTPPGEELVRLAAAFSDFSARHRGYVEAARQQFDEADGEEDRTRIMLAGRWVR